MKYKTIVIDPPWPQGKTGLRSVRPRQGKKLDYPTMPTSEIAAMPVNALCDDDSLVFLWTTDKFMEQAHQVLRTWQLKKHCIFVWNKNTGVCPFSVQFRNEYMLMAYKGKLKLNKIGISTSFSAKVSAHSRKPDESFSIVETLSNPPRLELFARRKRNGWDVWGNEVESDIQLVSQ